MINGKNVVLEHMNPVTVQTVHDILHSEEASGKGFLDRDIYYLNEIARLKPREREFSCFLIKEKSSQKNIGLIFYQLKLKHLQATFGIIMLKNFQKKELGIEAHDLMVKYLFDNYPIQKMEGPITAKNIPSIMAAKKAGYKIEGVIRKTWFHDGELHDLVYIGLLREEFFARLNNSNAIDQLTSPLKIVEKEMSYERNFIKKN